MSRFMNFEYKKGITYTANIRDFFFYNFNALLTEENI